MNPVNTYALVVMEKMHNCYSKCQSSTVCESDEKIQTLFFIEKMSNYINFIKKKNEFKDSSSSPSTFPSSQSSTTCSSTNPSSSSSSNSELTEDDLFDLQPLFIKEASRLRTSKPIKIDRLVLCPELVFLQYVLFQTCSELRRKDDCSGKLLFKSLTEEGLVAIIQVTYLTPTNHNFNKLEGRVF